MSTLVEVSEPPATPRTRRREWILRAAFEASLILLGLLGAFALNEWQDTRTRANRIEALLGAVRAELQANLLQQEEAAAYNTEITDRIWEQATAGVAFIPADAYPRGLFRRSQLTSAAWTTAQNDAVLSGIPVEQLLVLASAYDLQQQYTDDVAALFSSMYATLLQPGGVLRVDGLAEPLNIGGVLRDYARRGARLVDTYRTTLQALDADPAAAPESTPPRPTETPE